MSIFSKIRNAKKAANEHKRSTSTSQGSSKAEGKKPAYNHVPTHAAQDARIASSYTTPDVRQRIQEEQRKSRLSPNKTGSDMFLQHGSKMPMKQKSAGDLSIHSVMGKHFSQAASFVQMEELEVSNPYGFHPNNKRVSGTGSTKSSRINSAATTTMKGKSPLFNKLSADQIPEIPEISHEYQTESLTSGITPRFAPSSKVPEIQEAHPTGPEQPQSNTPIHGSRKSPLVTSLTKPSGEKGRVLFDFDQLDKYIEEARFSPSPYLPEYDGRGRPLSPIPQSPLPVEPDKLRLNRLSLNMKPDGDDWFARYSTYESALEFAISPVRETHTPMAHILEVDEPLSPAFALEKDLSLLCNFDDIGATPLEEMEEEFWNLSLQQQNQDRADSVKTLSEVSTPIRIDERSHQKCPAYTKDKTAQPPHTHDSWHPRSVPNAPVDDGKAVLTFAQHLRKRSRQSGHSDRSTALTVAGPRPATSPLASRTEHQQDDFRWMQGSWYEADDSGIRYGSHDSGILVIEEDYENLGVTDDLPGHFPVSPPEDGLTSYTMFQPASVYPDKSDGPQLHTITQSQVTLIQSPQYNIFSANATQPPENLSKSPPSHMQPPLQKGRHSLDNDWLSDDNEMWPIISNEPKVRLLSRPPLTSSPAHEVSPLDEIPPALYPIGPIPTSYSHTRTISSSTGISASSGRDRLRFPSRESSQRVRTTSSAHKSYDTWLSNGQQNASSIEDRGGDVGDISPTYPDHIITAWGETNSPMCIPEVTQYARFNNPAAIQGLYANVISPASSNIRTTSSTAKRGIIAQRSMPNLSSAISINTTQPLSPGPPLPTNKRRSRNHSIANPNPTLTSPPLTSSNSAGNLTRRTRSRGTSPTSFLKSPPLTSANCTANPIRRTHSRGTSPTNFTPPRVSLSDRPFLLQDPPRSMQEKQMQTLRPVTPLVTVLGPYGVVEPREVPERRSKLKKKKSGSRGLSMWKRKEKGGEVGVVAC
ncbi:hypothetical protein EJ08DRAFT_693618 [Tothia fuscella]|uniref:Uncharacterized protein n=1 Tax=Tothia fuscella TaxID=1048955 RepID=A0A9P4NY59_9PEZI|nr:hypothetical protein EJ08DRAFT_693618 [Tothia fuscella]